MKKQTHPFWGKAFLWIGAFLLLGGGFCAAYFDLDYFFPLTKPAVPVQKHADIPQPPASSVPSFTKDSLIQKDSVTKEVPFPVPSVSLLETSAYPSDAPTPEEVVLLVTLRDQLLLNHPCDKTFFSLKSVLSPQDTLKLETLCQSQVPPMTPLMTLFQQQEQEFLKRCFIEQGEVPTWLKKIVYSFVTIHPVVGNTPEGLVKKAETALTRLNLSEGISFLKALPPQDIPAFQEVISQLESYQDLLKNLTTTLVSILQKEPL